MSRRNVLNSCCQERKLKQMTMHDGFKMLGVSDLSLIAMWKSVEAQDEV